MRFMGSKKSIEGCKIVLRGYPFDGTASFKSGQRFAPADIRLNSEGIETYSPYFDMDIEEDISFYDAKNLNLPFGNTEKALELIEKDAKQYFEKGHILFGIGGEHLVSLPLVKACHSVYPDLHLIHFDAHADLREDYLGEKLSHATVMRRILDFLPVERFHQLYIRSGTREEFKFMNENKTLKKNPENIVRLIGEKAPVYITIDLDVLDPSVFPGTGTPEPGGIDFNTLVDTLSRFKKLNIVGIDFVELSPDIDNTEISTITACKLIRECMGVVNGK